MTKTEYALYIQPKPECMAEQAPSGRAGLSKRLRFEIFKRDQFTCRYCGRRPPDVVLEVDHIHPVSLGGLDTEDNLVTACGDCNRGKSNKKLGDVLPVMDSDLSYLEQQQEIAELRRYALVIRRKEKLLKQIAASMELLWVEYLTPDLIPGGSQIKKWIVRYSADEVDYAIRRASWKLRSGALGHPLSNSTVHNCQKYVGGILKSRAQEKADTHE